LVLRAAAGAAFVALAAAAAMSPWLCVRTVSWTGPLRLSEARYAAVEAACLGRPLLLLSEREMHRRLGLDRRTVRVCLDRHLPSTLEVRVEPRRAVAKLDDHTAIDGDGRVLGAEHVADGLPRLVGFELDVKGKRLDPRSARVMEEIQQLCPVPTLAPAEIRIDGDDLQLVLAESGTRVQLDASRAATQLRKLRIYEESLGSDAMPAAIDLRFQNQVVVRDGGVRRASRRAR
jgi:cell division septal protein FtsQ